MELVTCGNTEFPVRELPEKLRVLNTVDPDSGDSLLATEFKVREAVWTHWHAACLRGEQSQFECARLLAKVMSLWLDSSYAFTRE